MNSAAGALVATVALVVDLACPAEAAGLEEGNDC